MFLGTLVPVQLEQIQMFIKFSQRVVIVVEVLVELLHDDQDEQVHQDELDKNDEHDEVQ